MPSIAAHFVCAYLVYNQLQNEIENKKDFLKGCILPDIISLNNSHYKIKGTYYQIPDVAYYRDNFNIQKDVNKGYLCHLLLDKYFLEEYIPKTVPDYKKINLFSQNMMYNDYTNMNVLLLNKYNLNLTDIIHAMKISLENIDKTKYKENIKSITHQEQGPLKYIKIDDFSKFLEDISIRIAEQIKR